MIIETDCGNDPDDFFAICWLLSVGVDVKAIAITPGDPYQVAVVNLILDECGLDIPVGVAQLGRDKNQDYSGFHGDLLKKYRFRDNHDGLGETVIAETFKEHPDSHFFIIGPPKSMGRFLANNEVEIEKLTFQGGFLPYNLNPYPCIKLDKFKDKDWVPSFNPNGDRKGTILISEANIKDCRYVGKHICHTVYYDKMVHENLAPHNMASDLFKEGMDIYLERHDGKKFHDPCAAVCHLYPDVAKWVDGCIMKKEAGWTTNIGGRGKVIAALNYKKFWEHIVNFK